MVSRKMKLRDRPTRPRREASPLFESPRCGVCELAPADVCDPVIEAYKKDVDQTLLIENLKLTPQQRSEKFEDFMRFLEQVRRAGRKVEMQAFGLPCRCVTL